MATPQKPSAAYQSPTMERQEYVGDEPRREFPQELPPRPPQRVRSSAFRNCLTLHYLRSYSLRRLPDARTRSRRITMIIILLFSLGLLILDLVILAFWSPIQLIIFTILDFFFLWALGWWLAVIGDAIGERRVLGMTLGRKFFDGYLYFLLAALCLFFILMWFVLGVLGFQLAWIGLNLLTLLVAWIASEPAYYGGPRYGPRMV